MKYLLIIPILLWAAFLTVLTQVGGVVYLLSWCLYLPFRRRISHKYWRAPIRLSLFASLYLIFILLIMPPIAKAFGRVPLPFTQTNHVQPVTIWTAILNRNYVRPELRAITYAVASDMNTKYPGTIINYMDAGFPFRNGFPLIPHITHNDGKKLDVAFLYIDQTTGKATDKNPSPIGYGGSEPPRPGEPDRPAVCDPTNWQYSYMYGWMPLSNQYVFDQTRTKAMINLFIKNKGIGVLYLEPHLKSRLQLKSSKIRLHGCYSVRHDDHVHVQVY